MTVSALKLERGAAAHRFPPGTRCVAYIRESTERQAGETKVSPDTQRARCRALAAERGRTVEHEVFDRESGAHLERLDRLVAACQAHRLPSGQRGLICVYDTSRWGRFERPGVAQMFREQLHRLGWDVAIGDAPDTGNEAANLYVSTGQDIASSEYRKQLRQKVVDNMPRVAAQGCWQGRAPFGYVLAETKGGRRKLILGDEGHVATVRHIFKRWNAGATLRAITEQLNRDRVPGPFDQHPSHTWRWEGSGRRAPCGKWTASAVGSILRNETYTGRIIFKPREVVVDGRRVRFQRNHVPEEYWVVVEDAHPAIVERRTFEAARRRLPNRRKPRRWAKSEQPFILSGLMTCATCGGPVVGGGGQHYGLKDPGATRCYRCSNAVKDPPTCAKPILTVNQRWLENEVIGRVAAHVQKLLKTGALERELDRRFHAGAGDDHAAALGRELKALEVKRRTVVEKIAAGLITDDDARDVLAGIKARMAAVGRELEAEKVRPTLADRKAERERLLKLAADFRTVIKKVPAPVARELLGHWVESLTLDKQGRVGTLRLRQVPAVAHSTTQDRRGRERPCWPGASPPSSPT